MAKLVFLPFSIASGLLAGLLSKRTFEMLWGRVDDRDPPKPESQDADLGKLVLALVIEGAVFRVMRGLVNHESRRGFAKLTGTWPGGEKAKAEA